MKEQVRRDDPLACTLVEVPFWSYPIDVGKRRYRRQEQSLLARLQEHGAKVEAEQARDLPDEQLITHWRREIKAFEVSIARARKRQ